MTLDPNIRTRLVATSPTTWREKMLNFLNQYKSNINEILINKENICVNSFFFFSLLTIDEIVNMFFLYLFLIIHNKYFVRLVRISINLKGV